MNSWLRHWWRGDVQSTALICCNIIKLTDLLNFARESSWDWRRSVEFTGIGDLGYGIWDRGFGRLWRLPLRYTPISNWLSADLREFAYDLRRLLIVWNLNCAVNTGGNPPKYTILKGFFFLRKVGAEPSWGGRSNRHPHFTSFVAFIHLTLLRPIVQPTFFDLATPLAMSNQWYEVGILVFDWQQRRAILSHSRDFISTPVTVDSQNNVHT